MCGISGIISNKDLDYKLLISKMTKMMNHRGPDSKNYSVGKNFSLGHNRLAIIDLNSRSNQPMHDNSLRYTITYNGEFYNFLEIKNELKNSYDFKTNSDTEVLIAGYKVYGKNILDKINGCFAFAIYDNKKKELFFARDRIGIKPLYFSFSNGIFIFSSEIRSILGTGLVIREVDDLGIHQYLTSQSTHYPNTIIKCVKMLEPGSFGVLDHEKLKLSIRKYWRMQIVNKNNVQLDPEKSTVKNIRNMVLEAVEARQVSDVKIGAFLSGGLDSSVIVAAMNELGVNDINTFSLVHEQTEFDESKYSDLIAKTFNTNHNKIKVGKSEILTSIKEALNIYDSPSLDGINSYLVSKKIKNTGIRVALSGLGGDEIFSGYPQFRYWYLIRKYSKIFPRKHLSRIFKYIFSEKYFRNTLHYKTSRIFDSEINSYLINNIFRNISNPFINKAFNFNNSDSKDKKYIYDIGTEKNWLSEYSISELSGYTTNVLLKDTDQMSMSNSLEVRVPFLDHQLVNYLLNIEDSFKQGTYPKMLLIKAFKDLIPSKIYKRKKQGFTIPIQLWMKNELYDFCQNSLEGISDSTLFNSKIINQMWSRYLSDGSNWMNIWSLVILSNWLNKNEIKF